MDADIAAQLRQMKEMAAICNEVIAQREEAREKEEKKQRKKERQERLWAYAMQLALVFVGTAAGSLVVFFWG
jgi:hypothetical protein